MDLKKGVSDLKSVKEKAGDLGGAVKAKIDESLEEFKKAIDLFGKFGFKVGKFKVDMGALPEITTSVSGSLEGVQLEKIKQLVEEHKDNKFLSSMLKALVAAKEVRDRVELPYFTGVKLDIKLGVPPKISFDLQEKL
jgi:DNA mismatch repair ATPase MutL